MDKNFIFYRNKFTTEFINLSDNELIRCFNNSVGIRAFNVARSGMFAAYRIQFNIRNIDFSEIGDGNYMSFKDQVVLKGKKLIKS